MRIRFSCNRNSSSGWLEAVFFLGELGRVCIIYLREVTIVKSGHNEWKTKSAVEEVGQGEMKNQDCFACLQLRNSIWVPDALF